MDKNSTLKNTSEIEHCFSLARARYAALDVDVDNELKELESVPLSIHCWQGDDVIGFDGAQTLSGGILATGSYPGRARNGDELRQDAELAFSLIPGKKRFNLHAMYAETGNTKVDRDEIQPEHFARWLAWAKEKHLGIDFNPSFFSHPLAESGFTLASPNDDIRKFWVRHGIACRKISQYFADELKDTVVNNFWAPDGFKDMPADRLGPRLRLQESLDTMFREPMPNDRVIDTVESKLFGIGSEAYVVGSHEFYMGYASKRNMGLCLDMGHFHPTETIADKISSLLLFVPQIAIHLSRGVRWDSDHIVTWTDDLQNVANEVVRIKAWDRIHLLLDYFDASINRIAAWVIGARNVQKALLFALVQPIAQLRDYEAKGDYTRRLALTEEAKNLPFASVWDYYCLTQSVPVGNEWIESVSQYEDKVLSKRN
ncbi:MAG: L-rhamnose isomerase [Rectinema sp.]